MDFSNQISFSYDSIEEAFPPFDPEFRVFGSRVLVQIRSPKRQTAKGIILIEDVKETELWNTQVGKVIAVGPVAFRNRNTLVPWPEGDWCDVGDFVRFPKYGGDKWIRTINKGEPNEQEVLTVELNDLDLLGEHTGDPTKIKAFI